MPPQQSGWRRFHQVDALANADIHVVVDVGVVVVVDIDVDLPPLQFIRYLLKCRFCCEC